jgi:hypothetical protein
MFFLFCLKNKTHWTLAERLGDVWKQSFSAVLKQYCSIEQYCGIIYFEVFENVGKMTVRLTGPTLGVTI